LAAGTLLVLIEGLCAVAAVAETRVTPEGSVSVTVTPSAWEEPWLEREIWYVRLPPINGEDGEEVWAIANVAADGCTVTSVAPMLFDGELSTLSAPATAVKRTPYGTPPVIAGIT